MGFNAAVMPTKIFSNTENKRLEDLKTDVERKRASAQRNEKECSRATVFVNLYAVGCPFAGRRNAPKRQEKVYWEETAKLLKF